MNEIQQAFASIEQDQRWHNPGIDPEGAAGLERELGRRVPTEVHELLQRTSGGEWAGKRLVKFFDWYCMKRVNTGPFHEYLPEMFAFAGDGGPKWYFVDEPGKLGCGAGAVWQVSAGAPFEERAEYVAADVAAFVRWMIEGG